MTDFARTVRSCLAIALLSGACTVGSGLEEPLSDGRRQLIASLSAFIEAEMTDKEIPAISVALIDDQDTVWAEGFGYADPELEKPASAETVFRVGSVSKLFTDIGIMQLVERGELDLDANLQTSLPSFRPENPFEQPVTLRQLMAHRSGLIREPPVGHYFDDRSPTLAATVESLNGIPLVYPPETHIKYSNAAIAVAGYVLEHRSHTPFADYLRAAVLLPFGMEHSDFLPSERLQGKLAKGYMWGYDRGLFEAPTFQLGMAPAGSLYSSVSDLALFVSALFRGGGGVIGPETLAAMYRPQFAEDGATTGYGLGFGISNLDGERMIRHGGAIYGFSTELAFLPEEKLGAVVVSTKDFTNSVTERIAQFALRGLRARASGEELPAPVPTTPVSAETAAELAGVYQGAGETIRLIRRDGELVLEKGSRRVRLRQARDGFVVDDALAYGTRLQAIASGKIEIAGEGFERREAVIPEPAPERWQGLIGEYGWDHDILYILEKEGVLHALIEWFELYPLTELGEDRFAFPDYGLYQGEELRFVREASGRAGEVLAANVRFPRRDVGTAEGVTFRIEPLRPTEELRLEALAASPPEEEGDFVDADLVEPTALDASIRLDIRYATTNNFMGAVFYDQPRAFLQRPAAEALARAHRRFREKGYGILIHDAYRPWFVTKMFYDATPDAQKIFVADPASGSRHNRGAAVDLTLYELASGDPVTMVGGYDEFSDRSFPDYPGGTSRQRFLRALLRSAMEAEGFRVYEFEWWHFDYGDWSRYRISNRTFEELSSPAVGLAPGSVVGALPRVKPSPLHSGRQVRSRASVRNR